jgi:hypothetical protein
MGIGLIANDRRRIGQHFSAISKSDAVERCERLQANVIVDDPEKWERFFQAAENEVFDILSGLA